MLLLNQKPNHKSETVRKSYVALEHPASSLADAVLQDTCLKQGHKLLTASIRCMVRGLTLGPLLWAAGLEGKEDVKSPFPREGQGKVCRKAKLSDWSSYP